MFDDLDNKLAQATLHVLRERQDAVKAWFNREKTKPHAKEVLDMLFAVYDTNWNELDTRCLELEAQLREEENKRRRRKPKTEEDFYNLFLH